jgi:phage-related tail fiber protein
LSESGRNALVNVNVGEVVFQTTGQKGIYVYNGTSWQYGLSIALDSTNPTTLFGYGITDAVRANAAITAGTGTKITYDNKGLVTGSTILDISDIPNLPTSKLTGQITVSQLPDLGSTASTYVKVYVDATGRVVGGETTATLATLGITDAIQANLAITAGTGTKITYDEKGLVLSSDVLTALDIPNIETSKLLGRISTEQLPLLGDFDTSYTRVNIDATGRVIGGSNPSTLDGFGITDAVVANSQIVGGTATKITYDSKGLVTSSTNLIASDIPSLDASKITTGRFSANFLPFIETLTPGTYTKVTVDSTGRVIACETPTTIDEYGITDAMRANPAITPGTGTKITYDAQGLITDAAVLAPTDIPSLPASKIVSGVLSSSLLPSSGVTAGDYYKVTADIHGRITAGSSTLEISDVTGLTASLASKATPANITDAIDAVYGGVGVPGNTLKKIYDIAVASNHEITVADTNARIGTYVSSLPTNIFVVNDGDGEWALYKALATGLATNNNVIKLSDPSILNTANGYIPEDRTNKDTDPTLAANSDIKYPSQKAIKAYADTKVPKNALITAGTGAKLTYNQFGLVTGTGTLLASDIPNIDASKITSGILSTSVLPTSGANPSLSYVKVNVDTYGRVISGSTELAAGNIPALDASKITSGKLLASVMPNLGTPVSTYTKVRIDNTGRVVTGSNPTALADYGITDAVTANPTIAAGAGIKITYDSKGLVTGSTSLVANDIPNISAAKITSGVLNSSVLPITGIAEGNYKSITVDAHGRVVSGTNTLTFDDVSGLASAIANSASNASVGTAVNTAISNLQAGVPSQGSTLKGLYDMVMASNHELNAATVVARDALEIVSLPTNVFVLDDGDGSWALYKALYTDEGFNEYLITHPTALASDRYVKVSDQTALNEAMGASTEVKTNKSTNVELLDGGTSSNVKYPTQLAVKTYVDTQLSTFLDTVSDSLTDIIHTSALPDGADLAINKLVLDNDPRLSGNSAPMSHQHPISDIIDLATILDSKVTAISIPAGSGSYITYNNQGIVTSSRSLTSSDLPLISPTKIDGVLASSQLPTNVVYAGVDGTIAANKLPTSVVTTGVDGTINPTVLPSTVLLSTDLPGTIVTTPVGGRIDPVKLPADLVYIDSTGKISETLIPASSQVSIIDTITPVDLAEMNANTTAAVGTIAIVSSVSETYVMTATGWTRLNVPTGTVSAINGRTGVISKILPADIDGGVVSSINGRSGEIDKIHTSDLDGNFIESINGRTGVINKILPADIDGGFINSINGKSGVIDKIDATDLSGIFDDTLPTLTLLTELLPEFNGDVYSEIGTNTLTLNDIPGLDTEVFYSSIKVNSKGIVIEGSEVGTGGSIISFDQTDERYVLKSYLGLKDTASGFAGLTSTGVLALSVLPAFTGDLTSTVGSNVLTLKTIAGLSSTNTFSSVTVNRKGLVTGGSTQIVYNKAQADALFLSINDSGAKNTANGYAGLNADAVMYAAQLPGFVGDVTAPVGSRTLTLNTIPGVTPGASYSTVVVNSKGIVTSGTLATTAAGDIAATYVTKVSLGNRNAANGYLGLNSSAKIDSQYLPLLFLNNRFIVSTIAERNAITTAHMGDIAIVNGTVGKCYILNAADSSNSANWLELVTSNNVYQVNGKAGLVELVLSDINGTLDISKLPIRTTGDVITDPTTRDLLLKDTGINALASGATATYKSVTVNSKGQVTGGSNPTTLAGYGITDAINTRRLPLHDDGESPFLTLGFEGTIDPTMVQSDIFTVDELPVDGVINKLYRIVGTNKSYIWDGTAFVQMTTTDASLLNIGTLSAARLPAFTGDATSPVGSSSLTLANTGVVTGTYTQVTVDAKGRVTTGGFAPPPDTYSRAQSDAKYVTQTSLGGRNTANGYVGLDGGNKIDANLLPAISISDIFPVNSLAERDELTTTHIGDMAVVGGDVNVNYILSGVNPRVWTPMANPMGGVTAVNGATGAVSLTLGNITGSLNTSALPAFTGDVTSIDGSNTLTVEKIHGITIDADFNATSTPTDGHALVYMASSGKATWRPPGTNASNLITGTLPVGRLPALTGDISTVTGYNTATVLKLNGISLDTGFTTSTPPTNGYVLTYASVGSKATWKALDASKVTVGTLPVARLPAFTGTDVTADAGTGVLKLSTTGVAAGTYTSVTVNTKGRVTAGTVIPIVDAYSKIVSDNKYVAKTTIGNRNTANGYVGLNSDNKMNVVHLPAITMNNIFAVSTLAQRDALTTQHIGDVAIVGGTVDRTYILSAVSPKIWIELLNPLGGVLSLNGATGVVNLTLDNIEGTLSHGALPEFTGDVTSIGGDNVLELAATGTAGTYYKVTTDTKGRVTSGSSTLAVIDLPALPWSKLSVDMPTTLAGFGITDAIGTSRLQDGDNGEDKLATVGSNGAIAPALLPALTGDVESAVGTNVVALTTTGVTAGTYTAVTVDTKGRVTSGSYAPPPDAYTKTETDGKYVLKTTLGTRNAANGWVGLDSNSKINASLLPSLAINSIYPVNTLVARDALTTTHLGDVAIVGGSVNVNYMLTSVSPRTWTPISNPLGSVTSINGETGEVTLNLSNIAGTLRLDALPTFTGDVSLVPETSILKVTSLNGIVLDTTRSDLVLPGNGHVLAYSNTASKAMWQPITAGMIGTGTLSETVMPAFHGDAISTTGNSNLTVVGLNGILLDTDFDAYTHPSNNHVLSYDTPGVKATWKALSASNISTGILPAARLPALTGDIESAVGTNTLLLTDTGVAAGTYSSVTVDTKGRVVSGTVLPNTDSYSKIVSDHKYVAKTTLGGRNEINGFVGLNSERKIDAVYLPDITLNDIAVVSSIVARDALTTTHIGDIAIVGGSVNKTYILSSLTPRTWTELVNPLGGVSSLNGQTGNVNLTLSNIDGILDTSALPVFTGDVVSEAGSNVLTLATAGTAGTYFKVTTDTKGRVTAGVSALTVSDIPTLSWSKVLYGRPSTLSGYGITNAITSDRLPNDDDGVSKIVTLGTGGKIDGSLLPAIAISDTYTFMAADATKDSITLEGSPALSAQRGDIAIVGGTTNSTYILSTNIPGNIADWVRLNTGAGVISVNGLVGTVVLDYNAIDSVSSSFITPGAYSNVTVNAHGRITGVNSTKYAALNSSNTITAAAVPAFTGGDIVSVGGTLALNLIDTGVEAGTYNSVSVDSKGRVVGGTNVNTLTDTGVTAGTYKSVTVDVKGRVSAGTNPTTLAGYGITDSFIPHDATWDMFSTTGEATVIPGGEPVVVGGVSSVNGKIGTVSLVKGDLGLGNVNNTTDAAKPISTATQTALDAKQNTLVSGTNIKTINGVSILGNGDVTISGSGEVGTTTGTGTTTVLSISPVLVTPNIGTPSAGNLSNCTADGTNAVGFLHRPQVSKVVSYTCVLSDAGKHIYHPASDLNTRTYTIPANGAVAYPIGTEIKFVNMSANNINIAINTDTMYFSGPIPTGTRVLALYGTATALKITDTSWIISGTGLT